MMIKFLLICNILIVVIVLYKYCINRTRVDINHVFCFTFGYIYYCIIPFVCFEWEVDFQGNAYQNMLEIYRSIPKERIAYYIGTMYLINSCFIFGAVHGKSKYKFMRAKLRLFHARGATFNFSQQLVYPIIILLAIVVLYLNRASLFRGYVYLHTLDSYNSMRVLLSVFEYIITIYTLYYINSNPAFSLVRKVCNKWTLFLTFYSLLLITTGGRLYVITSLLSMIIFLSFSKSIRFRVGAILVFGFLFALIMGVIGISRLGFVGFDYKAIVFNIFEEPLYTNYSNITYLKNYSPINIVCVPTTLFSAIINILPTSLFPWKLEFIKYITDIYPKIEQPLGATHFYPSYNAGLGLILSMILFYLIGKWLGKIYKSYEEASITKRVVFCLVCAGMAFSLYRDPISTSLVKNIAEFSVILPWIITALNDSLHKVLMSRKSR